VGVANTTVANAVTAVAIAVIKELYSFAIEDKNQNLGDEIKNQQLANRRFAEDKGIEIVESFMDLYVSGATPMRERDGYSKMLKFCEANNIKIIITYDLSRISRGDVFDGLKELRKLTDEGYIVYFSGQPFLHDIKDPMLRKKLIIDFLWFAEMYREDIRKRTIEGLKRAKAEGKKLGRPEKKINWKEVEEWRKKGLSWMAISKIMDIPYLTLMGKKREYGVK
jgi:DNA invertase Pin-like site-specific DNA recombinase